MTVLLKALKVTAACLLVLLLLVVALSCWVIFTESGTRLAFDAASRYQLITYQSMSGSISDGLEIKELQINTNAAEVGISDLTLKADWSQVLYSKVDIEHLAAQRVTIRFIGEAEAPPSDEPISLDFLNDQLVFLPLEIQLQQLSITQLDIVTGEQQQSLRDIQLSALFDERGITATSLKLGYQQTSLQVDGDVVFAPRLSIDLTLNWQALLSSDISLTGNGRLKGTGKQLRLDHKSQGSLASDVSLQLLNWRKQPRLSLEGKLPQLSWPLGSHAAPQLRNIVLTAKGDFSSLEMQATGKLQLSEHRENAFDLTANVSANRLKISQLQLSDNRGGKAQVTGQLEWPSGAPRWQGQISLDEFDGQSLQPLLPQQLVGQIDTAGSFEDKLQFNIISNNLQGELQTRAFGAQLNIHVDGKNVFIEQLKAHAGDNHLTLIGRIEENHLNINFDSQLTDLKLILPATKGTIETSGSLTGTLQQPTLKAKLLGQQLSLYDFSASEINLDINLQNGVFLPSATRLSGQNLRYQSVYLNQLSLLAEGPWQQPNLQLQTDNSLLSVLAHGELQLSQPDRIEGQISRLRLQGDTLGDWQLAQPVKLIAGEQSWSLSELCLQDKSARVCVEAANANNKHKAHLVARQLPVALLNAFELFAPAISGLLDIDAQLEGDDKLNKGQLRISQSRTDSPLLLTADDDAMSQLSITDLVLESRLTNGTLTGELDARLNDLGSLNSEFEIRQLFAARSPLQARINYTIPDLQSYGLLIPDADVLAGELEGSIQLGNSLQNPQLSLFTRLTVPHIVITPLAIEWHDLTVEITTLSANEQHIKGSVNAGDGQLNIDGTMSFTSQQNWLGEMRIKGDNVLLLDQPNRRVVASPDMLLKATADGLKVTGLLRIPEAKLKMKSSPNSLSLTSDAVIHGEENNLANSSEPYSYQLNLDVLLGEQVSLEAYGLKTDVTGKLSLNKQPTNDLLGYGELNLVNGAYQAYGQDLTIERGVIRFTGLLGQPEIELTASRKVKNVIAGLKVNGQVDNLRTRLYSQPPLQDSEILSYIIRGKPLRDANAADQNALANALLSYSISQSTPITSKLTELSGLDEIGLDAEEGVETLGFTLGKYITPRLYARYGIGVVDKLSKVFLQYQLSDKLYLETESGQGQSVDLMYRSR